MQGKATYEFVIIRYVPKVEREEFINVGAILFSKHKKYLGIRYKIDKERLLAFSPDVDIELLQEYLEAWTLICAGDPKGGVIGGFELADRFRWLAATKSTTLQCSKTHPGLCHDPEKELDDLFEKYVK